MSEEEAGFTFTDKRSVAMEDNMQADHLEERETEPSELEDFEESDIDDAESIGSPDAGERPPTYDILLYCTQLLAADAWQKLGLLADPRTGEATLDLAQAKVGIDAIGDLINRIESASELAVPQQMRRELRTLLNDLRLNYVGQRDRAIPQS